LKPSSSLQLLLSAKLRTKIAMTVIAPEIKNADAKIVAVTVAVTETTRMKT
jgi:hypothetical protein